MLPVRFTQAARADIVEAQDWYQRESPDLSHRFRAAIEAIVGRLGQNPLQFPVVFKGARRALLRRFPYMLFFVVDDDQITVIACFHASREPRKWQRRVP